MPVERWTPDQLKPVLELYVLTPFGRIHSKNPDVIALASRIGRSSSAVALKMVNFASLDPTLGQRGMKNASKLDREIWEEFFDSLIDDTVEGGFSEVEQQSYLLDGEREGRDIVTAVKVRRGQSFFRRMILASYDSRCSISSISNEILLVASHIDPWSLNISRRLDPTNGICLCSIFDKAFENGLVAVGDDFEVLVSSSLSESDREKLRAIGNSKIRLPSRFLPDQMLFRAHRSKFSGKFHLLHK